MATVTIQDLVDRAQTILQDTTDSGVRWPTTELVGWLNDAYREIVLARPDANSDSGTFTCAAGTRQQLDKAVGGFPTALRLLDVVRNVAAGSNKGAIRSIERAILDDQRRTWHGETGSLNIEHFMLDPRLPREFLVYPPALATTELEVVYSSVPAAHNVNIATSGSDTLNIVDSYANAILDYMLYRAYSKDAEYAANAARAMAHYQAMQNAIGVKTASDSAVNPIDVGDRTIRGA